MIKFIPNDASTANSYSCDTLFSSFTGEAIEVSRSTGTSGNSLNLVSPVLFWLLDAPGWSNKAFNAISKADASALESLLEETHPETFLKAVKFNCALTLTPFKDWNDFNPSLKDILGLYKSLHANALSNDWKASYVFNLMRQTPILERLNIDSKWSNAIKVPQHSVALKCAWKINDEGIEVSFVIIDNRSVALSNMIIKLKEEDLAPLKESSDNFSEIKSVRESSKEILSEVLNKLIYLNSRASLIS